VKADGAVTSTEQLGAQVASATLVPGEQVVTARFVAPSEYRASGSSIAVPDGLLQTTIAVEPQRAVGGVLTPGSTVAVVASFTDPDESHIVLQKVLVTNVQLQDLGQTDSSDSSTTEEDDQQAAKPGSAPDGQLLVTLALDPGAVERVVFAAEHGTVWLALDPESAREDGTRVLNRENVYQ
jgi:pilus assembly protein CpaB